MLQEMDCPVSCEHRAPFPNKRIINGGSLAAGLSCSITLGSGLLFYRQMQRIGAVSYPHSNSETIPNKRHISSWETFKHLVSKSRSGGN